MKKSIKLFTLSLLTSGMLVGCGGNPVPPAPDWSAEQKEAMRENLHGEVLPYFEDQPNLNWVAQGGEFLALGETVTPEVLAQYAEKFTGWTLVSSYKDSTSGNVIMYTYEKAVTTEQGERYVQAQFAGVDEEWNFVENGKFLLAGSDPYFYSWATASQKFGVEVNKAYQTTEIALPEIAASRYEIYKGQLTSGETAIIFDSYTTDTEAADKFYAALEAITGEHAWHLHGGVDSEGTTIYVVDSPDGKYGLGFYYDAEGGTLTIMVTKANYLYEFPQDKMNDLLAALEAEGSVPALVGDYYSFNEEYNCAVVYFDSLPNEEDCGYTAILEAAGGWEVAGLVDAIQQYVATTADGKASLRYWFELDESETSGALIIEVGSPAFVSEMPESFKSYIPDVEGASKYIASSEYMNLGIYYESEDADGGYTAILEAAEFESSVYSQPLENGSTIYFAFDKNYSYIVAYNYFDGCLAIALSDIYGMEYYTNAWPSAEISELNRVLGHYEYEVPELEVASEEAAFDTYIYGMDFGSFFYEIGAVVQATGATQAELEAYFAKFSEAGWTVAEGSTFISGSASKVNEETAAGEVEVEWMAQQDAEENWVFALVMYFADPKPTTFDALPVDQINEFISSVGYEGLPAVFGDFTIAYEGENFEIDESFVDYGFYIVYANCTTSEECAAFIASCQQNGWVITSEVDPDYPNDVIMEYRPGGNETGIMVSVVDYSDAEDITAGYVGLQFSFSEPVDYTHVDEFPLEGVNEFLSTYELGFALTAALPTDAEAGYDYAYVEDGSYHGLILVLSGDHFDDVLSALVPLITADNQYTVYEGSAEDKDVTYANEADHQVSVYLDEDGNTVVQFWE